MHWLVTESKGSMALINLRAKDCIDPNTRGLRLLYFKCHISQRTLCQTNLGNCLAILVTSTTFIATSMLQFLIVMSENINLSDYFSKFQGRNRWRMAIRTGCGLDFTCYKRSQRVPTLVTVGAFTIRKTVHPILC